MRPNLWATDGGVYFGHRCAAPTDPDRPLEGEWEASADLHQYAGDRHLITIGPNGSGKTRRLLIPNLLRLTSWSILVIDPKGELAMATAAARKAAGSEIVTLDPFGLLPKQYPGLVERQPWLKSAGLNPLAALDPESDDFPDDAKAIGEALIKVEGKNDSYWAKSAQALVAGLVMAARLDMGPEANLDMIRDWIGLDGDGLGMLLKRRKPEHPPGLIDLWGKKSPALAAKLNRFAKVSSDNRELTSIISTAQTQTDWLDSGPVKADLRRGVHDFGQMKERPTTVYLILPPRYLETHATWLRLAITAVLTPLIRTTGGRVPVLFMLDEFAQLGRLEVIERNMALMRGYGVKLWPLFQDLAQAQDVYEGRWESFISNAGVLQAFAPQDKTTRQYLSDLSGQRFYAMHQTSLNSGVSHGIGWDNYSSNTSEQLSVQHHQGPVWWPQALGLLKTGQSVMFSSGRAVRSFLPDPSERGEYAEIMEESAKT